MANILALLASVLHFLFEVRAEAGASCATSGSYPNYRASRLLQLTARRSSDSIEDLEYQAALEISEQEEANLQGGCRKVITYTQLPREDLIQDQLAGNFSLELKDIAVAMISGREAFFRTAHETVLRYAPRGVLIKARGKCPCSFRAAFRTLKATHPDAKWYYVGDEDAVVDLSQLREVLSKYNPSDPLLVASNGGHAVCSDCGACPEMLTQDGSLNTKAFFGGNGQILSQGLVQEILGGLEGECTERVRPTLSGFGDLENTCSMVRSWKPHFRVVQLEKTRVFFADFMAQPPPFISAHHLCVENVKRLSEINKVLPEVRADLLSMPNAPNDGCAGEGEEEQHQ